MGDPVEHRRELVERLVVLGFQKIQGSVALIDDR
jgi:hypothetical protein